MLNDIGNNPINFTTTESIRQDRERSKREDLECCEKVAWLESRIQERKDGKLFPRYDFSSPFLTLDEELLKRSKMRCSEHCGNTVREAQETSSPREI